MSTKLYFTKAFLCFLLLLGSCSWLQAQTIPTIPQLNPQIQLPELPTEPYCAGAQIALEAPFTGFLPNITLSFSVDLKLEGAVTATTIATLTGSSDLFGNGKVAGSVPVPNIPGGKYSLSLKTLIVIPPVPPLPSIPPIPVEASGIPVSITNTPAPNLSGQTVVQNSPLTLTASNCAGTLSWTGAGTSGTGSIAVNTSQVGSFDYSAVCTVNGCVSQPTNFVITVTAPQPQPLKLVPPTFNCQTGEFTYNTEGGDGSQIEYYTVPGITGWTTQRNHLLNQEFRTAPDAETLLLKARQNGVEVQLAWNIREVCPLGGNLPANQAPSVLANIPSQNIYNGKLYSYQIPGITFGDPNGGPLTLSISGQPGWLSLNGSTLSGTPDQNGQFLIKVTATDQGGLSSSTSFSLKVSTPLTLITPTYECNTGHFHFNTAGGDGSLVEFYAIGITGWTINPSQSLDQELRTAADAPTITLKARQNGQEVTLDWNVRDVCPVAAARRAVAESGSQFNVRVLGSPVQDEVAVEVTGVQNQTFRAQLVDAQGKVVGQQERSATNAVERIQFSVGSQPVGTLMLRVSTPTQKQTVRLLKR